MNIQDILAAFGADTPADNRENYRQTAAELSSRAKSPETAHLFASETFKLDSTGRIFLFDQALDAEAPTVGCEHARAAALKDLQQQVYYTNVVNGWHDSDGKDYNFAARVHRIRTELDEAVQAYKIEGTTGTTGSHGLPGVSAFAEELADVLISLLDMAQTFDVDLPAAVTKKVFYNSLRGHLHKEKVDLAALKERLDASRQLELKEKTVGYPSPFESLAERDDYEPTMVGG